jgi:hypothetical protein
MSAFDPKRTFTNAHECLLSSLQQGGDNRSSPVEATFCPSG